MKHFTSGDDTVDFINTFSEKNKIFLLADFELLKQELNGLRVIEKTKIKRSILVTSHYNNRIVLNLAIKSGTKVLPKQLASEVEIKISTDECDKNVASDFKEVDLVVIDDVQLFADSMANFFRSKSLAVDAYYSPKSFLDNLSRYSKNTKICMDNDFGGQITGFELAKQLNKAGYMQLYMLSGKTFENEQVPSYLTMLLKGDMTDLDRLA